MLTAEPKSINNKIKIVASEEKPSFSNPKVMTWKNANRNNIGRKRIKSIKIKQPTGKKNILSVLRPAAFLIFFI